MLNATPQEIAMYNLNSAPLGSPKLANNDDSLSLEAKLRDLQAAVGVGIEEVLSYQTFLKAQLKVRKLSFALMILLVSLMLFLLLFF